MRVLSIGSDPHIFDKDSASAQRMIGYGEMVERYDILARAPYGQGDVTLSANVHVFALPAKTPVHAVVAALRRIPMLRRQGPWDVVTAQDPFDSGLAGWLLARVLGAAFHVQVHGDFFGSPHWKKERLLHRVLLPLACFLVRRADAVRAVSEMVRDGLVQHGVGAERVTVSRIVSEAVLVARAERDGSKRFPTLLWVGRFETEKNPLLALRAFAAAREMAPSVMAGQTLGFVGQGTLRDKLEKEIVARGLTAVAFVEPWTKTPMEYYTRATVLLLTSNHEGWGRVIEEAGRASLPVLMTSIGGAGELVRDGETGFVVPIGDTSALAKKILFALSDQPRLFVMGKKLADAVRNLSNAAVMKRLLYQSWESAVQHFQTITKPILHRLRSLALIALTAHAIMFLAFLFRFGTDGRYGWYVLGSDDVGYLQIAENIWHGVFSRVSTPPLVPDDDRMPLYPLLLSLNHFIPLWSIILLQQIFSIIGILFWYATARRYFSERVAWWSTVLFTIEPTVRFWTAQVATEALFAPFWFGALFFFSAFLEKQKRGQLVAAAALLGAAVMVRPIVLFYPIILLGVLCWVFRKQGRVLVQNGLLFLVVFGACLTPWVIRNTRAFGIPAVSLKMSGIQFYENASTYLMWKEGVTRDAAIAILESRLSHPPPVARPQENKLLDAVVFDLLRSDPFGYAFVMSKAAIPFFLGDGYVAMVQTFFPGGKPIVIRWDGTIPGYVRTAVLVLRDGGWLSALYLFGKFLTMLLFVAGVIGAILLLRQSKDRWWVLWLISTILYFAATSGSIAYSRYRFPVVPCLMAFSVVGAIAWFRWVQRLCNVSR
jgi:glycosyltransferase involved in cell wall biosynthesis